MPRFKNFSQMYGEFKDNTDKIKPYGYTIIKAKFIG